jgi:hypothetical protein
MKKNVFVLAVIVVLISLLTLSTALAAGKNGQAGKSKVGHLYLYEKSPVEKDAWPIVEGGAWGKMNYKLLGNTLDFVFNGHELPIGQKYKLIAYKEPWPAVGLMILGSGTTNEYGDVHIMGTSGALPVSVYPESTPASTEYNGCGTKIWLVLAEDVGDGVMGGVWRPDAYLFEGDLIYFACPLTP